MSAPPVPSDAATSSLSHNPLPVLSARSRSISETRATAWFRAATLAILLGLAALIVGSATPPYQSPDSFDHLRRAAAIASGQWVLTTPPGSSSGTVIDTGLQAHMDLFDDLAHRPQAKVAPQTYAEAERIRFSGQASFVVSPGTGLYAPPIYLVHAAGWAIGQALGLTVDAAYRLVSVLVLLACVAILAVAFRIRPPTPVTFALLALPMTVFQLGSPTIDGICTSLFLLWLAIYLRGLDRSPAVNSDHRRSAVLEDAVLVALAAALISSRLQMWPLLLLLTHRAWQRRSPMLLAAALGCTLAIAAWIVWAMGHSVDGRVARPYSSGQVLKLYLSHPRELAELLWRTLIERTPGYVRSFVGVLGWMDTAFRLVVYGVLLAWLAAIVALQRRARRGGGPEAAGQSSGARQAKLLLLVGCALSVATILVSLLAGWTPYPSRTIMGVQGRYFLPAALMVAAIGSMTMLPPTATGTMAWRRSWLAALALLAFVVPTSVMLLTERYSPSVPWPVRIMSPGNEFPQRPAAQGPAAAPPRQASPP